MAVEQELVPRVTPLYGPGHSVFAITPHDTNTLTRQPVRGVFVGVGGDITGVVFSERDPAPTVTFKNVPSGTILNVAFTHIHATDTTATDLIGLL